MKKIKNKHLLIRGLIACLFFFFLFSIQNSNLTLANRVAQEIDLTPCVGADGGCITPPGGGGTVGNGIVCGNGIWQTGEECEGPNSLDTYVNPVNGNGYCSADHEMWCNYQCK